MGSFDESLKVPGVIGKVTKGNFEKKEEPKIKQVKVADSIMNTPFDDRVSSAVIEALMKIPTNSQEEEARKKEYMQNLSRFMGDFDRNKEYIKKKF